MTGDILKKVKIVIAAIFTMVVLIVAFQNTEKVPIQLLFWNPFLPKILILFVTFVLGALTGILGNYLIRASRK